MLVVEEKEGATKLRVQCVDDEVRLRVRVRLRLRLRLRVRVRVRVRRVSQALALALALNLALALCRKALELDDGDTVRFSEVKGMEGLNAQVTLT